jgi:DNA polymerase-1
VAPIEDTMLISYVLEAGLHGHGMDELSRLHLGHSPIPFKQVAGTGKAQKSFRHVALEPATAYAAEDADVTFRLWEHLKPRVVNEGLSTVYETLERPMPRVLVDMELAGIRVDPDRLRPIDADLQVPDTTRFTAHTGWTPRIPYERTMGDLLDYWRDRVAREGSRFLVR